MTPLELRAHGAALAGLLAAAEAGDLDCVRSLVRLADDLARGLVTDQEVRALLRVAEPTPSPLWLPQGEQFRRQKRRRNSAEKGEGAP